MGERAEEEGTGGLPPPPRLALPLAARDGVAATADARRERLGVAARLELAVARAAPEGARLLPALLVPAAGRAAGAAWVVLGAAAGVGAAAAAASTV